MRISENIKGLRKSRGLGGQDLAEMLGVSQSTIRSLNDRGSLPDIEGISYYSWKDTGATALIQAGIPIDEVMKQLRHSDLSTTQVYIQGLHRVNEKIRDLDSLLL